MRVLIAIIAAVWVGIAGAAEMGAGKMTVTGQGRIDSAPDMATITLGVTNEAETAGEAMDKTSAAVAAILEQLAADGMAARDMQTRDLNLSPLWTDRRTVEDAQPQIVGFQASNTVVIRVRELDALGGILDRVIDSGANTFNGLSFGLQNPEPALDEARRTAVAEALRKAKLYAEAAGLVLGPVLELSEGGASSDPVPMARFAMAEAVPIAQGEVTTDAFVTMIFAITSGE
jgi:uncharacterized protein YggE